ncbi:MAG: T9SS C-terminal target domain-containing protein [Saprospirales bacterium]|nr:MAG: T9SS C-terminal target domain-containing protein [Saprospirales bacterium]
MNLRFSVLFLAPFLFAMSIPDAQLQEIQVDFEFNQYSGEYIPLENAENLTTNFNWGSRRWNIGLDSPAVFSSLSTYPMHLLGIENTGRIALWHYLDADVYEMDIYAWPFATALLSPLRDPLNSDTGWVFHHQEGNLHIIEFRNVALAVENVLFGGRLNSRLNYMVEVDPDNDAFRFIYGPSTIHQGTANFFEENRVGSGLILERWEASPPGQNPTFVTNRYFLLENEPDNPDIVTGHAVNPVPDIGLTAFPEEGTIYEFRLSSLTSIRQHVYDQLPFEVFPNPGGELLNIVLAEGELMPEGEISVFSLDGTPVHRQILLSKNKIKAEKWPAGTYIVVLESGQTQRAFKWIRK